MNFLVSSATSGPIKESLMLMLGRMGVSDKKSNCWTLQKNIGKPPNGTISIVFLWEWENQLKKRHDNLILSAFGGGFYMGPILY